MTFLLFRIVERADLYEFTLFSAPFCALSGCLCLFYTHPHPHTPRTPLLWTRATLIPTAVVAGEEEEARVEKDEGGKVKEKEERV